MINEDVALRILFQLNGITIYLTLSRRAKKLSLLQI